MTGVKAPMVFLLLALMYAWWAIESAEALELSTITAADGNELRVYTHEPDQWDKVWFVVHGSDRNADDYCENSVYSANRYGALTICIEFPKSLYSSFTFNEDLYETIEQHFDVVRTTQQGYYILGHSAGSQFVHRMLTFYPDNRIIAAVPANAGWYTLPNDSFDYPYGTTNDVSHLCDDEIHIMAGELDTQHHSESSSIRSTPEAVAQGENRLERSLNYYAQFDELCGTCHPTITHTIVPDVGHSKRGMIPPAADRLFWDQ